MSLFLISKFRWSKIAITALAVMGGITFSPGNVSADRGDLEIGSNSGQIYLYYFYFTPRCEECEIVEKATLKLLNENYSRELKNKRIIFQIINLTDPDPESKKIIEELKVRRQLLLLVQGETIVNLTRDAFRYAENQYDQFRDSMKNAIDQALSQ
jgi:hypothetical protein